MEEKYIALATGLQSLYDACERWGVEAVLTAPRWVRLTGDSKKSPLHHFRLRRDGVDAGEVTMYPHHLEIYLKV